MASSTSLVRKNNLQHGMLSGTERVVTGFSNQLQCLLKHTTMHGHSTLLKYLPSIQTVSKTSKNICSQ